MARSLWIVNLIKRLFVHRNRLARLTRFRPLGRVTDRALFAGDDLCYLPRDTVITVNQQIPEPEQLVLPSQVVEHFIEQAGCIWIMNFCICRESEKCQDYPRELGCIFLGEAANGIHPKLGRPVSRQQALDHAARCREAGLIHLIGRNKLDTVWLNVKPGEKLLTICHCCPCCCLWRMLPHVTPDIGNKVKKMPGVEVRVTDRCEGCGTCCQDVCFVDAIALHDERAAIGPACRGCSRCADVCPQGAIEVSVESSLVVDQCIHRIATLVDIS